MSNVYLSNPKEFIQKVEQIKSDGASKLHIVADFSKTLTGDMGNGQKPMTSWSMLAPELGENYKDARQELYNKYYPIEIDNTLDEKYRSEQISIWWTKHLELLVQNNISESLIKSVVEKNNIKLRSGVVELFKYLSKNNIPLLIYSGGLGDIIKTFLEGENLVDKNIHFISNFFKFNSEGIADGFQNEIVHTFNKTEVLVANKDYMNQIVDRSNCILLGDTLYDAKMADGINHKTVLKIGFLNDNQKDFSEFEKVYDLIIEKDTDMSDVNEILTKLF